MNRGKFIVFEGLDGSGKTTQLNLLCDRMRNNGKIVMVTSEPSDNEIGRIARSAVKGEIILNPHTISLLFAADRVEHIKNFILPELEKGNNVICDRFYLSNFAYQGDISDLDQLILYNKNSMQMLRPDMTLYMNITPEKCLERINLNRLHTELFENIDKLTKVYRNYKNAIERLRSEECIEIIDAINSKEYVSEAVWKTVNVVF